MCRKPFLCTILLVIGIIGVSMTVIWGIQHGAHKKSKGLDGILMDEITQYAIYWVTGMKNKGVSKLSRRGWRPVGWTPTGKFLVWIGEGPYKDEKDIAIALSDPCGQEEPRLLVDLSTYPNWELSPSGIHWMNDDVLLLNIEAKRYQPNQPCCYIWRVDVGSPKLPSEWKTSYSVVRVLSPQVLVLWSEATRANLFWTPQGTFPLPRSWENPFFSPGYLSPDGRWLAWEGDDGIYVGPFDPRRGVLSEKNVAPASHFRLLGWQQEPLQLLFLQTEGENRHTFWALNPQTGKRTRLRTLHIIPKVSFGSSSSFLVGPAGQRVVAVWFDSSDDSLSWWAYVDMWDLATETRLTLVKKKQSVAVPIDWKRVDISRCPKSAVPLTP